MSNNTVVVQNGHEDTKAKSFLEAIGLIEQASTCEVAIPEGSYPTPSKLTFSNVAILHALRTTILTFIVSPVTMLVLDKYIHIFGKQDSSFMDRVFAVLLSSAPAVGFALFFSFIINKLYVRGRLTKSLLSYYITPYITMKFIVTIFMFMIFYIIYNNIMTQQNIYGISRHIYSVFTVLSETFGYKAYCWTYSILHDLKIVLIKSAVYSTFIHLGCAALIGAAYIRSYWRSWLIDIFSGDFG